MTIVVMVRVQEGIVLASDSAVTLGDGATGGVLNVYNNANKIVNLHRDLPLGVATWGGAAIGDRSITTVLKDLRHEFTSGDDSLRIDPNAYTVRDVARRVDDYVREQYVKANESPQETGMLIVGFDRPGERPEQYQLIFSGSNSQGPQRLDAPLFAAGQPQAFSRLALGVDPLLPDLFESALGVPRQEARQAVDVLRQHLEAPIVTPAMPFQDAIDLAEFLVNLTIQWSRFCTGPATVGGPVEVAGISKHEGFNWIRRKHYYGETLNPRRRDEGD